MSPHRTVKQNLASETNLPLVPEFAPGLLLVTEFTPDLLLVPIFHPGLSPVGLYSKTTTICGTSFCGGQAEGLFKKTQFFFEKIGIRYFELTWTWWRA